MNYFYDNLKYIRNSMKLSQNKFATKIGFNVSTVNRWEKKELGISIDNAIIIAEKLKVPLPILVGKNMKELDNIEFEQISSEEAQNEIERIVDNSDMTEEQKNMIKSTTKFVVGKKED